MSNGITWGQAAVLSVACSAVAAGTTVLAYQVKGARDGYDAFVRRTATAEVDRCAPGGPCCVCVFPGYAEP